MQSDAIDYAGFIDRAMRGVVRDVLKSVQKHGLSGDHHFYLTFRTDFPGAHVSETLKSRYPHEMTIVLQHQFWDFRIEEKWFGVTLSFGGVPEKLEIPFASMTAFADPSVKFGLQFQAPAALPDGTISSAAYDEQLDMPALTEDSAAEIISLDAFRKK